MTQTNRTLAFVLAAVCSVGIAAGTHIAYKPAPQANINDVGTAFFPDFSEPGAATYLRIAAFNSKTNKTDQFSVEKKDGKWRIPSHHNYPADGRDRLGRTAASLIGVTRGQLVDKTSASHARLNLLDPLDEKLAGTEGRGNRITLKADDKVLTDLIVGKKEDAPGTDRYYVRRADEDRVYLAEISPDLSTKFVDWIEPNLLEATASNFRQLILDRYHLDEVKRKIIQGDKSIIARESSSEEWKLEGIAEGKQLKTSVINQMVSSLSDMKIVGVRPKPAGLGASLKGSDEAQITSADRLDMQNKGFFITQDGGLLSKQGDFLAGTSDGIVYVLRFGEVVTGDDIDIEIGGSKQRTEEAAKADEAKDANATDKPKDDKDESEEPKKQNRYVFVTVQLDEALLGEKPVEPLKPTPPPGYVPPAKPETPKADGPVIPGFTAPGGDQKPEAKPAEPAAEKKDMSARLTGAASFAGPAADDEKPATQETPAAEAPATETPKAETPAVDAPKADAPAEEQKPAAPAAEEKPATEEAPKVTPAAKDPIAEYEAALKEYEQAFDEYKVRINEYEERLKKSRDIEKRLNDRFADWFYVIPADVFDTLNVSVADLTEAETGTAAPGAAGGALPPGFPNLNSLIPSAPAETPAQEMPAEPKTEPATPATPKPAEPAAEAPKAPAETPAPETKAEEAKPADPKPAEEPKPEQPKAEEPKAETPATEAPKEEAPKAEPAPTEPPAESPAPEAAPQSEENANN